MAFGLRPERIDGSVSEDSADVTQEASAEKEEVNGGIWREDSMLFGLKFNHTQVYKQNQAHLTN